MLNALRLSLASKLLGLGNHLEQLSSSPKPQRSQLPILIFFHGYSIAHTIRPLVIARQLRERGYPVELAGRGSHIGRVQQEGFVVHDVETLPQHRMDQYVARGNYRYYDYEWIHRCVQSERELLRAIKPTLVVHDMKPTVSLATRLEGIDDAQIIQAYSQPGYQARIHVSGYLSTEIGPFDEYLAHHSEQVKPQKTFYLMADIPEFHPQGKEVPGFYYVGPLLDRPEAPPKVEILDEGWDTSLPLVYLTCGSSGRPPEYLEDLIEKLKEQPFRLLVTAAGRWAGEVKADNIRVVDFLPGEWVLRRAQILVGIVGIGAIYQALSCGVPVVGAPEHLDQEYHLNRIEALGLGIKLDRQSFKSTEILKAIRRVLDEYQVYKQKCTPFRKHLEKWFKSSEVANLIDRHFQICSTIRINKLYLVCEDEFIHYLERTTPNSLSREPIQRMLRANLVRGIPHEWRGNTLFFDRLDSWNWLYDNEPRFFEADYRALEEKRRRFFIQTGNTIRSRRKIQCYRMTYSFRIAFSGIFSKKHCKLFLPYPLSTENQFDIQLLYCQPPELKKTFLKSLGFFYGFEFEIDKEKSIEYQYTCELKIREQSIGNPNTQNEPSEAEWGNYLDIDPKLLKQPEVIEFFKKIGDRGKGSDEKRAQVIYGTLIEGRRFKKTKDQAQGMVSSTIAVLKENGGHCISLSRAFIALCRAEGIPAREVSGALIGYPLEDAVYMARSYNEPLFGHTWAEIFVKERGWIPVEFHSIVIGKDAMTENNIKDPRLEKTIVEKTQKYQDYYFGHVDNQRVICSNSVKRIPQCLVEDQASSPRRNRRWIIPDDISYECQLEMECI